MKAGEWTEGRTNIHKPRVSQAWRDSPAHSLSGGWRKERKEKVKDGGGGGGNPNPKQMASIGARNTESRRKIAALLSLIHTFQGERGSRLQIIGDSLGGHYYTWNNELMIQPSDFTIVCP